MAVQPIRIAPSLLSCDFARIADEVRRCEEGGADWLHVDVMDGHFVPNLTIGPPVVRAIRGVAEVPLDVHLMITDPVAYAPAFADAGADVLTFHLEAAGDAEGIRRAVKAFRDAGVATVGISINPDTPIERIADHLEEVELVLVMSVFPGFGGQRFRPEVLGKVEWLRDRGWEGIVEMDGGLDGETIPRCVAAGASALVSGSAIFGTADLGATIRAFRAAAEAARAGERVS